MNKLFSILIIIFFNLCFNLNANFIKNPGFEIASNNMPVEWIHSTWKNNGISKFYIDDKNIHTGNYCLTIQNPEEDDSKLIQYVKVKPKTIYKLSGFIKASGINENKLGANITVLGILETSKDFKETYGEWKYVELIGRTGPNQTEVAVSLRLGGYGNINKGKASFDDIEMSKVKNAHPDSNIIDFFHEQKQNNSILQAYTLPNGQEVEIKKKKEDRFHFDVELAEPTIINTPAGKFKCIKLMYYNYRKKERKLYIANFSEPQIANTPVGNVKLNSIRFHKSEKIKAIFFTEPHIVDLSYGKLKLNSLRYDRDGTIGGARLSEPQMVNTPIGKIKCKSSISIYRSGIIRIINLSESQMVNTQFGKLKLKCAIQFDDKGKLKYFALVEDAEIYGKLYKMNTAIYLKNKAVEKTNKLSGNCRIRDSGP